MSAREKLTQAIEAHTNPGLHNLRHDEQFGAEAIVDHLLAAVREDQKADWETVASMIEQATSEGDKIVNDLATRLTTAEARIKDLQERRDEDLEAELALLRAMKVEAKGDEDASDREADTRNAGSTPAEEATSDTPDAPRTVKKDGPVEGPEKYRKDITPDADTVETEWPATCEDLPEFVALSSWELVRKAYRYLTPIYEDMKKERDEWYDTAGIYWGMLMASRETATRLRAQLDTTRSRVLSQKEIEAAIQAAEDSVIDSNWTHRDGIEAIADAWGLTRETTDGE